MNERSRSRQPGGATRAHSSDSSAATPGKRTLVEQATESAGAGAPLPAPLQAKFERSLGSDLGDVRVHTGAASSAAAGGLAARAFATGRDIHFSRGAYDPASRDGERLLAHEVAHTVQQGGAAAAPQTKLEVSAPGDRHEVEADRAADRMIDGLPAQVSAGSARGIARSPAGDTGQDHDDIYGNPADAHATPGSGAGAATAPAAGAADALLPRARDGQVFQNRNTAVTTWGNVTIPATRSWMRAFLDFYGYGPAFGAGDCTFNMATSTTDAMLDIMSQQATANGYGGIDRAGAAGLAQEVMATRPRLRHFASQAIFSWQIATSPTMDIVDGWLGFYGFGPSNKPPSPVEIEQPGACSFNGREDNYDAVVDVFMDESRRAGLAFTRSAVRTHAATSLYIATHPVDAGGPSAKDAEPGPITLGVQAQITKHHGEHGNTVDPLNIQLNAQVVVKKLHQEGKMGFELSMQGSASFTFVKDQGIVKDIVINDARLTNTQAVAQVAWVVPFLKGALQVQSFAQAVGGLNWTMVNGGGSSPAQSQMRLAPQTMAQGVGGIQVVYAIPGTGQHLQIFAQGQKSLTATTAAAGGQTRDNQVAAGVQWNF